MLLFVVPPGYRRKKQPVRPKLDAFTGIIDQILETDKLEHKKQKHTSKRIFERLRDEYGFEGGITIVKDYIFAARQRQREMFVPPTLHDYLVSAYRRSRHFYFIADSRLK
jgi:hypothetical protein